MKKILLLLLGFTFHIAYAQTPLSQSLNFKTSVKNGVRTNEGIPGPKYWVNKASYKMDVSLDPMSGYFTGSEDISYTNNSPDTLHKIVLALYQNFYKKGLCADYNTAPEKQTEGVIIKNITIDGQPYNEEDARQVRTNLFVKLTQPILPHATANLHIEWSYIAREGNVVRTGNYGEGRHFVAYFYPKVAVYDDMDGWDTADYLGIAEFYSDFNDYDVKISVPKDFVVWATGDLANPSDVLQSKYVRRLAKAKKSNTVVSIIDSFDIKAGNITKQHAKNTWHYTAQDAPDFAFALDKDHLWDGWSVTVDPKTGRKAFVDASYEKESADYYQVAQIAGQAIIDFSTDFPGVPYPFPAMTIFNAPSGMEFPMMCNDGSQKSIASTMGLTYHEIAHTYFPFYMGINERKYAWMDEGWATIFPTKYIKNYDKDYDFHSSRVERYLQIAGTEKEVPVITLSKDQHNRLVYRHSSYNKPYLAYLFLKEYIGEEQFTLAIQTYIKNWHGKHPTPYDFFKSYNASTKDELKTNLDWFWKNWFYEKNYADLSLSSVAEGAVYITNTGGLFVPIELIVTPKKGQPIVLRKEMDFWLTGTNKNYIMLPYQKQDIQKIELNVNGRIPDANLDDNTWKGE